MAKSQILTEEHKRRARSIGGTEHEFNISYVKTRHHRCRHTLFGNMNAFQICDLLNYMKEKPDNKTIVCKFINGTQVTGRGENNSKNKSKISDAWKILFKGMDFKQTIEYINNVWLDPSYHFYVEEKT